MRDTTTVEQLDTADMVAGLTEFFREQIADWRAAGVVGIPLLVLAGAAPARAGWCVSCGGLAPDGWRCADCLEAVTRALELEDRETRGWLYGERPTPACWPMSTSP
jgi:hypothetical protein